MNLTYVCHKDYKILQVENGLVGRLCALLIGRRNQSLQ
jgi:3-oxoacyl-[acyl-carrier-protein] synthase III